MELGKLDRFFAFLFLISLVPSFSSNRTIEVNDDEQFNEEYKLLKSLVELSRVRISYGKLLAKYKWITSIHIYDEPRGKAILKTVEKAFNKLSATYGPEEHLFFIDLMQGTKVVEYGLFSNWNLNDMSEGELSNRTFSLHLAASKMKMVRTGIIKVFPKLKTFQYSQRCHVLLTKAIHEVEVVNDLYLRALQRTFGNYCKNQIKHAIV